jgi:predicted DNA-binding transcriptional regulator
VKEMGRPAVMLVEGPLDPSKIVLEPSLDGIKHTPKLDEHISAVWDEAEKKFKAKFPDREFTNGSKVLVRNIAVDQGKIAIKTGITDYKERIATIKPEYRIAQRFGLESVAIQLATSSIILTGDNKICLAQLGSKTDEKNRVGGIHTIGGLLDMRSDKTLVTPADNILDEISEELGFEIEEVERDFSTENVLGIIQDPKIFATDIIYLVSTKITRDEILAKRGKSDKEIAPTFIDNTAEGIADAVLVYAKTGTATALSGLYLYGKMRFGDSWAESVRERLVRRFTVWDRLDSYNSNIPEEMRVRTKDRLTRLHS